VEPLGVAAAADQRRRPLLWVGGVPDTAGYVARRRRAHLGLKSVPVELS